jgi:hypothetical protein
MSYRCHPNNPRRQASPAPTPQATRKPINTMTPDELRAWLAATRAALHEQQRRGRAYLDYRAKRGTYTPTDTALERDQLLAVDLLLLLDELEQSLNQGQQGVYP